MTLTRDEVLAMTHDQLRVEIARDRGYTVCAAKFFDVFELILDGRVLAISSNKQNAWHNTPNWPTSIADTWELVEDVNAHGYTVNIQIDHTGVTAYFTERGAISIEPVHFMEYGNTASIAICRVWLLWNEERKEQG